MQWFTENWQLIIAIIIGIYEVLARLIPTVGSISLLAVIIDLLKWLSDRLDKKIVQ